MEPRDWSPRGNLFSEGPATPRARLHFLYREIITELRAKSGPKWNQHRVKIDPKTHEQLNEKIQYKITIIDRNKIRFLSYSVTYLGLLNCNKHGTKILFYYFRPFYSASNPYAQILINAQDCIIKSMQNP